jgi:hypothetical protein
MHEKINEIFERHQRWLDSGGDRALKAVRDANLISCIDQALTDVTVESQNVGWAKGYESGWVECAAANGPVEYGTPTEWQRRAKEELRKALEPELSLSPSEKQT